MRLASVIVTYNPPGGLAHRVCSALEQTDFVVIVDNGSVSLPDLVALPPDLSARVHVVRNSHNAGLAAALNQGISRSIELGASKTLLLDHDSTLAPGMVKALCEAELELAPGSRVAALVPAIRYALPSIACRWPSSSGHWGPFFHFVYAARLSAPTPVDLAIGSGMLVDVEAWDRLGRFDEGLFIDLVDTEFCLRARRQGYQIIAVPGTSLQHELGAVTQRRLLGLRTFPTHHSATRHYYINRNRITLSRRYAREFPGWMAYELLGAIKLAIKALLFETDRPGKLRSMIRGTADGLRGRSGPISLSK